jgi:hypothetical protein
MFKLQLATDNAAFEDGNLHREVARILREAADKLEDGMRQVNLRDANGNLVGGGAFDED